jgi:hypothetical protein
LVCSLYAYCPQLLAAEFCEIPAIVRVTSVYRMNQLFPTFW